MTIDRSFDKRHAPGRKAGGMFLSNRGHPPERSESSASSSGSGHARDREECQAAGAGQVQELALFSTRSKTLVPGRLEGETREVRRADRLGARETSDEHPEAEGPMQLQTLNQLRAALCQVDMDADAYSPVTLPVWVVALAARKLARALR